MIGLNMGLWGRRSPGPAAAGFVSPNGLNYFRNDPGLFFEDSGATTPATDDADGIGAWKNDAGSPLTAVQTVSAREPVLELVDTDFDGRSSAICVDDQTTPTQEKFVILPAYLTTAMNSGFVCFAQHARPAGQNRTNKIFSQAGEEKFQLDIGGALFVRASAVGLGTALMFLRNPDRAVFGARWDGRFFSVLCNGQEIGMEFTSGATSLALTNGADLFMGNWTADPATAAMRVGKWCPLVTSVLTADQCYAEMAALGTDMGLPNVVTYRRVSMPGNSHYYHDGLVPSYTNLMPAQLAALLGADYQVENQGWPSEKTQEVALRMLHSSYGAIVMGNSRRTKAYTVHTPFTPSRTAIVEAGTPWSNNEFAGWTLVMASGAQAGLGAIVASNTTGGITLASPGLPASPAAGDTFYLFQPMTQRSHLIAIPYEITNDSYANADADGITALSGVWDDCPIWQRFRCFVLAMKAYGFRVIGMTNTDRTQAGRDANYDTDEPLYNARILANAEGLFDATYDAYTALGVNTGSGNFLADGVHWSDAGAGVIAAGLEAVIEALVY